MSPQMQSPPIGPAGSRDGSGAAGAGTSTAPDTTLEGFVEAVRACPTSAAAHRNLAEALAERGRFGEARSAFERSLVLAPAKRGVRLGYARAMLRAGRDDDAVRLAREELQRFPGDAAAADLLESCAAVVASIMPATTAQQAA